MSGYVPHDDDVQMAYIHGANGDTWVAGRADALRAEFDRWLAEHDRQVKAEAWDEGWDAGLQHWWYGLSMHGEYRTENPYRKEKNNE